MRSLLLHNYSVNLTPRYNEKVSNLLKEQEDLFIEIWKMLPYVRNIPGQSSTMLGCQEPCMQSEKT